MGCRGYRLDHARQPPGDMAGEMKLSNDPNEDKARKATALGLLLLGVLGAQRDPRTFTVGSRLESLVEQATTPAPGGITGGRGGRPIPGLIGLEKRALPGGIGRGRNGPGTFLLPLAMTNQGGSWRPPPSYINQILMGGPTDGMSRTLAEVNSIWGSYVWTALAGAYAITQIIPTPGTLHTLEVTLAVAPGAGNSYQFRLYVNGVGQDLLVTISGTDTHAIDTTHRIAVSQFDRIYMQAFPTSNPSNGYARWSMGFQSDIAQEVIVMASTAYSSVGDNYGPFHHGICSQTTADEVEAPMPCAGVLKTMCVFHATAPGAGNSVRHTLRVNGADSALTVLISGGSTQNYDIVHEVNVSRGDMVCWKSHPVSSPPFGSCYVSCVFVPDTANQQILTGMSRDAPSSAATEYNQIAGARHSGLWTSTLNSREQGISACTMHDLIVTLTLAPGVGKNRVFTVMRNGIATALTCTIQDNETVGEDTTHEATFSDGDFITIECDPFNTPALPDAAWGAVIN